MVIMNGIKKGIGMRKRIAVIVTVIVCTISMLSGCGSLIKLKDQDGKRSAVQENESLDDKNKDSDSEEDEEISNDYEKETSKNAKEDKETSNDTKDNDEHSKEFVVDNSGYLSEDHKKRLSIRSGIIGLKYGFDIVMVVIDDYDTVDLQTYSDDFYDYNGYNQDGLVLVISMNTREYYFSTSGKAIENISDDRLEDIAEAIMPYMQSNDLYEAFDNYISLVEEIMGYDE